MKECDSGTVLKLRPLGEHGLLVYWITAANGLIHTAARTARKPGSDMFGHVDLFHCCELTFSRPKQGDLLTLHSASLQEPRLGIRQNLNRLRLAAYMCNLLMNTVEEGTPAKEWYDLITNALDYVAATEPRKSVLLHYERRVAELHGLYSPLVPPVMALRDHFRGLPAGRDDLLAALA